MTNRKPGRVHVVIGGQYGSEGKGEFIPFLSHQTRARHVVRTGGPNAGHSVTTNMGIFKMRQIPAAWMTNVSTDDTRRPPVLYIGPGSLINTDVLIDELRMISGACRDWKIPLPSIYIDESAIIIGEDHVASEQTAGMRGSIGSTTEGIGAARADHIMRNHDLKFAKDWWNEILSYQDADLGWLGWTTDRTPSGSTLAVTNVSQKLDDAIHHSGEDVVIESTQGFGLSLVHSGHYPFATSRDVTPGIILNDAGLSSREDHLVYAVVRTMPIRVAGNSGPMHGEVSWDELVAKIDHLEQPETTTVTGNQRRIAGELDFDMLERMVRHCRPDGICLTFLDYQFPQLYKVLYQETISNVAGDYINDMEERLGVPVMWVSTGPGCIVEYY